MRIPEFLVETWLNPRVEECRYNFGSSCVQAFTVGELLQFVGMDEGAFLEEVRDMSLHYGHFFGLPRLLEALSKLYENVAPDMVLTVHGGTGANNAVITELTDVSGNVVAIVPNYQQHYDIPASLGAEVRKLVLREENGWLPDLDELAKLVDAKTCLITLSNPNNPTGTLIDRAMMTEICKMADRVGAYVLSDEIYRGLGDAYTASVVDVYERGIATCSTSKVFSMAGTRVGWIVARDKATHDRLENRRSFDTICCGVFDELITAIALEHAEKILARSTKIVAENRAILDKWLEGQPLLRCKNKSYSSTAFVSYDSRAIPMSATELGTDMLKRAGILVCHGDCFDVPHSFRMGYGYVEPAVLEEGLGVMGDYFAKLKKIGGKR
ncbi:aminotransferase class I/II-fold pyridoxal phosphate-dependent enzyme [Synergistaceae bacterium OttesenSCG-928-I11]|nr:aminotransferase class I/II-fold pyridoxal phosphate-dependent enzyme [Synergistaceae bacterium OttesenSCG-928-I11]